MKNNLYSVLLLVVAMLSLAAIASALDANGVIKEIRKDNTFLFQIDSSTVSARLDKAGTESDGRQFAMLSLRSRSLELPISAKLYIGESKQYDTNLDGINDLEIRLESVSGSGKASLFFREISQARVVSLAPVVEDTAMVKEQPALQQEIIAQPVAAEPSPLQPVTGSAVAETGSNAKLITWFAVIAIIVIAIIYIATMRKAVK